MTVSTTVRVTVSLILVAVLVKLADVEGSIRLLESARWDFLLMAFSGVTVNRMLMALRWRLLLRGRETHVPFWQLIRIMLVSGFLGTFVPSSLGTDVLNALGLTPHTGSKTASLSFVLIDRIVGLFVLSLTGAVAAGMLAVHPIAGMRGAWMETVFWVFLAASAAIGATLHPGVRGFAASAVLRLPLGRLRSPAQKLYRVFDGLGRQPFVLLQVAGVAVIAQLLSFVSIYWLSQSLALVVPPVFYFLAMPVVLILVMVPISMGGVGVEEGALAYLVLSAGASEEQALGLALLYRIMWSVFVLAGGLLYAIGERKWRAADEPASAPMPLRATGCFTTKPRFVVTGEASVPSVPISPPQVSVAIPLHNEEDGIRALVEQLRAALETADLSYEVVMVDDGSTDATWARLAAATIGDARWRLIRFRRNFGQTAAMACGIAAARGQVIVTMDGDLQNDPADIPKLLAKLDEEYDVVCGWRHQRQDKLWTRKVPSMVANRLIGWLTGVRLHDYGCSLKAYRADVIKRTPLYAQFHRFIPALSTLTGALIAEVKVTHHPRRFGRTKYTISRTWRVALDMITVSMLIKFATRPLRFFGMLSLGTGAVAGACLARSWYWYVVTHHATPQVLPAVAVLTLWLAGHLLAMGWAGELCLATAHSKPERMIAAKE